MKPRSPKVYYAMMAAKQRFRESSSWFPLPCLLSFYLVLQLTAHVVLSTNPRTGHPASALPLAAEETIDSVIWFSVIAENGEIVVADNYRKVFRWPEDVQNLEGLGPFIEHLKERSKDEIKSAALSEKIYSTQKRVIIAVDQNLKYRHFRPILYALAEARITKYGFETIDLEDEASTEQIGAAEDRNHANF